MKKVLSVLSVIVVCLLGITGCPTGNDDPSGSSKLNGFIQPSVQFVNRNASPSKSILQSRTGISRAVDLPEPDASLNPLRDFYDKLGTLRGSYTPTEFKLFIQEIVLHNNEKGYELDYPITAASKDENFANAHHYADFVTSIILKPEIYIDPGTYTGLFFFFFTANEKMGVGKGLWSQNHPNPDFWMNINPRITVTIPGISNVWEQDVQSRFYGKFDVKKGSGDTYQVVPEVLQPTYWQQRYQDLQDSNNPGEWIERIQMFAYQGSDYRAILPGAVGHPRIWSTDPQTLLVPNHGSGETNNSVIIMPLSENITIPKNATGVKFEVQWDLDGIVEVYDHGTPNDTSDDIVVLARNFWERFSLKPTIDYDAPPSSVVDSPFLGIWVCADGGNYNGAVVTMTDNTWTMSLGGLLVTGMYRYGPKTQTIRGYADNSDDYDFTATYDPVAETISIKGAATFTRQR
ncbi:putative lipoprotein [Treponema primitia ZAS-2]|uniref:Putative lipoprotein n=1 Tax=Treponema primitia (strain ATCC BAA-887 / DSM 12427 / ZAS-2) TaxID=545694 RepID=F5YPB7_TREPZ|nr:hypothetical protein [Treponema primitia]AEF85892.1 putative lipoprotein [Treponema primitia ZAS-2]